MKLEESILCEIINVQKKKVDFQDGIVVTIFVGGLSLSSNENIGKVGKLHLGGYRVNFEEK